MPAVHKPDRVFDLPAVESGERTFFSKIGEEMTKTARLQELTGPQALTLVDEEVPTPSNGEVLVRMQTAGLNRAEWLFMHGEYLVSPELPARVGVEGAGVIEAIGAGVTGYDIGQEVCISPNMPFEKYGVIGEHAIVPISALVEKPENLDWDKASSIWMAYPTAYGGLVFAGGLSEGAGQTVLISAASSSVGLPSIQIAKAFGATVIATSRTLDKEAALKAEGADYVIATNDEAWPQKVLDITDGNGFDIAFDAITGKFTSQMADAAAPAANIVTYGVLAMEETPLPVFPMLVKAINFTGFHVVFHLLQQPARWMEAKAHILAKLKDGTYRPKIAKTFSLDEVVKAYEFMEAGTQVGKIIVRARG